MFAVLCLGQPSAAGDTPDAGFEALKRSEAVLSGAMAKGDAAALWLLRRELNAAALLSDFGDVKPTEQDIPCLLAHAALADLAASAITAIASDTVISRDAGEARAASRKDADDAASAYLDARANCALAVGKKELPALRSPLGAQLASSPLTVQPMPEAKQKSAMQAALAGLETAEKTLAAGAAAGLTNAVLADGVAALFTFGRAQALIPENTASLRPCRRLGGALFQLYDMAAASTDMRLALGKRFDPARWNDAAASFDAARADAARRKSECAKALERPEQAQLHVPEKLLLSVPAP